MLRKNKKHGPYFEVKIHRTIIATRNRSVATLDTSMGTRSAENYSAL